MKTISHEFATTRKPHRCFGCCETFPVATQMYRHTWRYDGINTAYWCQPCQQYYDEAVRLDPHLEIDGVEEGFVKEAREMDAQWERQVKP